MSDTATPYQVYMLRCADGSLYTGLTTDLSRRLAEHQSGLPKGARYTATRRPVSLAWQSEPLPDRASAARLEWRLKRLSRRQKERWLQTQQP
ncbi:MAG: GIY-YIG nuclease family protein [Candidatus Sericytochromatia bacterium]|nr:GIY-YIG nuclease family protein [Candidatus Sericytochromatia bacterium]